MFRSVLSLILCILMLLPLVSCADGAQETATSAPEEVSATKAPAEEGAEKEEEEKTSTEKEAPVYAKVDDPLTPEKIAAIPIAREGMSTSELRRICVDYVKLSVTFQWISNSDLTYHAQQENTKVTFREGQLWGGIPYINTASGNIYRIMEYYDSETGILDIDTYFKNNLKRFGTACSGTTGWGWARVINSASTKWTSNLTVYNGLMRIGPYTYDDSIKAYNEDGADDCKDIAKKNGEQVMYESYALAQMADCFVNNGHVRMCSEDAVVVRNEDGTIDGKKSYVMQVEQGLFTTAEYHNRTNSLGYEYKVQGNPGRKFTFAELYKSGYLPHTFKEFHGLDPIEPAEASLNTTETELTSDQFAKLTFRSNYVYSDLFFVFRNSEGEVTREFVHRSGHHYDRSISMTKVLPKATFDEHAKNGDSIEITAQLGNGEKVPVFSGKLIPES